MSDEYRLRKDIDKLKEQINRLDLSSYSPSESAKIMDKFDRDLDTLDTDLVTFSNTLINLKGNLVAFNQELIDFDEDNENLAEDLSKLKDNLHSFTSATQKLSTDLGDLDTALNQLDDDVFGEDGLDFQLTNLTTVLGDNNSGLIKSMNTLQTTVGDNNSGLVKKANDTANGLSSLSSDVEGLGESVDGLMTAVGDNDSGLVKSMNTLQTTVGDANSGLVKKANDTASSLNQLSGDVSGLGTSVTGLVNTVGDNNSGLVKGLNDLSAGLESLEDDVFGQNGLESSVNGLSSAIGDSNSGLTKELNDLDEYTKDFYDDVYGTNGLNTQLSALEGVINNPTTGLSAQINGLDNRVFGTGGLNDSIFGTNGLASRIGTAEGGLSNLTGSLDTLVEFLTDFEGTLDDFEEALEEDEDIDTSQLNSSITALLTLIAGVKKDVDVVDRDLSDVSNSFDGVKTNLYGTKTITVDGQNVTVPKEPTDTADATSLRGHLKTLKDETVPAVQDTLYGGEGNSPSNPSADSLMGKTNEVKADLYGTTNGVPNDPSTASNTSFKTTIEHLRDETVPTVQGVANQAKTSASTIKGDLYGTKTVDGQTVPREPNEASSTSFKTTVTTLRDTTVPAVQGEIFGTDNQGNPILDGTHTDDSLLGRAETVQEDIYGDGDTKQGVIADLTDLTGTITDEGGLIDQLGDVGDNVNNVKGEVYGTKTVNGQTVPREPTDTPSATSLVGRANTVHEDIYGDGNTKQGVIADLGDLTGTITDEGGLIDQLEDVGGGVTAVKGTLFGSGENNSPTNPAENSVMGKTNAIKSDLYGTKTVNGQTVPKDKTDTPDANSVRGLMKTITEDDIPTVKNIAYGEGEYYIDERTHERVYYDEENPSPTSSLGLAQIVDAGLTTANGHITNIQNMSYGADQIDPDTGLPYTANKPSPNSIGGLANSAIQQIGDKNTGGILYDIDQVQGDITEIEGSLTHLISENRNKQILFIGEGNSLFITFRNEGIDIDNINYMYDTYASKLKIRNKDRWTEIDNNYINELHFICGIVLRQDKLPSGTWTDWIVYSVEDRKFYKRISNTWADVTNNTNVLSSEKKQFMLSALFESYDGHTYSGIGFDGGSQIDFNKIVKNLLTVTNTQLSLPNTFTGHVYFTKYGRLVICDYRIEYTPSTAGEAHLGNIPTDYLPASMYSSSKDSTLFRPTGSSIDVTTGTHKPTEVYPKLDDATSSVWQLKIVNQNTGTVNHARGQVMWFTDIL